MYKQKFENPGEGLKLKLGQLIKKYIRKIFIETPAKNMHQKLIEDLFLFLVNSLKYNQCIQETLLYIVYFESRVSKITKNLNSFLC